MAGPAPSMAHVPLGDVLPGRYLSAESELRRLASQLDRHPLTAGRSAWHWYGDRTEPPHIFDRSNYLLLVETTITLYSTRDDWLELTLNIAWQAPPSLTVDAAVEVACWCPRDHNMHQARSEQWHVDDDRQLIAAFAAGAAMLLDVLASGHLEPNSWRAEAGLPDAPHGTGDDRRGAPPADQP